MSWDSGRYIGKNNADNQVSTSAVASDADGSVLERLEFIQVAVGGAAGQLRVTQSEGGAVEENAYLMFNIGIYDVDSGAVASANIDITSITNVMQKSTGGGAFATGTQTQPTFAKANGSVYCSYQFLAAEWAEGDMYKLTVTGITATIAGDTAYVPDMVWSNVVTEFADLEAEVAKIPKSDSTVTWNSTALASIEAEATDALEADGLDHLVAAADGGTNPYPDSVVQESITAYMLSKNANPVATSYNNTTDSLEMLSDKLGGMSGDGGAAQDDSVKASLDLAHTDLDAIITDISAAVPEPPTANSLQDTLHKDGSYTYDNTTDSLEAIRDVIDSLGLATTSVGRMQMVSTTIDLNQAAASYDLLTGTSQVVVLEKLTFQLPNVDVSDDAAITSISIQTDDVTPSVIISSSDGVIANLTAEAQIAWTGSIAITVATKIQLTIAGGAADATTTCNVFVHYRSVVAGGTLA